MLEVGFRPRRGANRLAIQPPVVDPWKRRFAPAGLLGWTPRARARTPLAPRMPGQATMDVFQRLDNNPLVGRDRVQRAWDSLGYRDGHTTVWPLVALDKAAHPTPKSATRLPNPDERPHVATAPQQVWCAAVRDLGNVDHHGLYRLRIFDGDRRAIGGARRRPWSVSMPGGVWR